ncbi:MAG: hypothetical protein B5766_03755 [Candidatus Lumbricidophila eiseniae]|uniref:Uncharacterized protein n=1 Tax=Candidatus Lumbricidiphila eiseniae TaxID=1969409 RepID=A0A2A6FT71_9MICO|nr:MAG: hypothetical protein B5766_03755 [Candidatus Lumbricidophila eiseniae]
MPMMGASELVGCAPGTATVPLPSPAKMAPGILLRALLTVLPLGMANTAKLRDRVLSNEYGKVSSGGGSSGAVSSSGDGSGSLLAPVFSRDERVTVVVSDRARGQAQATRIAEKALGTTSTMACALMRVGEK